MVRFLVLLAALALARGDFLAPAGKPAAKDAVSAAEDDSADDEYATATSTLNVTMDKTGPLGMHVEESDDSDGLKIKEIQATGLAAKYNEAHPTQKIKAGMDIVEINGATDTDAIGEELRSSKHLVMRLQQTTEYRRHCDAKKTAELLKSKGDAPWKPQKAEPAAGKEFSGQTMDEIDAQLAATDQKSNVDNEEFLLGLLIMHQTAGDWLPEQFLDAVCDLSRDSSMIRSLYWHHNDHEPMAAQLAALMDEERKFMAPTVAPPMLEPGDFQAAMGKMTASVSRHGATKK